MTKHCTHIALSVVTFSLLLTQCGCNSTWTTYGLFTRPELRAYDRYAVFGLDAEQEQIFMAQFIRAFGNNRITFVERQRITGILSEQDFLRGRLKENTRAQLQEIYGVEALILCEYTYPTLQPEVASAKKLRVRILDTETAAIVGSVVASKSNPRATDNNADFIQAANQAVAALKEHVTGMGYY